MHKVYVLFDRIKMGLVLGLLVTLTGCVGVSGGAYYDDGGYYTEGVVVQEPDVYLFGGGYDRGRDVRDYSHRGAESRGAAHPTTNHGTAHPAASHGAAHPSASHGAAPSGERGEKR